MQSFFLSFTQGLRFSAQESCLIVTFTGNALKVILGTVNCLKLPQTYVNDKIPDLKRKKGQEYDKKISITIHIFSFTKSVLAQNKQAKRFLSNLTLFYRELKKKSNYCSYLFRSLCTRSFTVKQCNRRRSRDEEKSDMFFLNALEVDFMSVLKILI